MKQVVWIGIAAMTVGCAGPKPHLDPGNCVLVRGTIAGADGREDFALDDGVDRWISPTVPDDVCPEE